MRILYDIKFCVAFHDIIKVLLSLLAFYILLYNLSFVLVIFFAIKKY